MNYVVPNLPAHYAAARAALAQCRNIEEVKDSHLRAEGLEVYAFKAKDRQLIENAAIVKRLALHELRARMKALKIEGKMAKGTRGQLAGVKPGKRGRRGSIAGGVVATPPAKEKTLEDYGIDKNLAKQARAVGELTPSEIEADVSRSARLAVASLASHRTRMQ